MTKIKTLITDHIHANVKSPVKTTRLGPIDRSRGKARPLKVAMADEDDKIQVLVNSNKLKNAPEPFKSVSVACDMSKEEREENKQLVQEAKRLSSQESGNFIYLVRGPPWDRRIIRVVRRT